MNIKITIGTLCIVGAMVACSTPPVAPAPETQSPKPTQAQPATIPSTASNTAPIKTQAGPVQGLVTDGIQVFKGIPYAAPPVGNLRWKLPEPPIPWQEVRPAIEYGHPCIQPSNPLNILPVSPGEDCLTLNVWTPKDTNAKLPVMVYIHGGSFTTGAGSEPAFNGQFLSGRGAVVVTINYRLGPLGFFTHPALEAETPNGPMNFGWYDQVAALQWVQQNIAAFGGDPGNVTIFGESAGAESVLAHLASPLSRGLFQRGIVESAGITTPQTRAEASAKWANLYTGLGLGDKVTAAALRAVPAEQLVQVQVATSAPILGDSFLPQPILTTIQNGSEAPVPLIIGSNSDEGSLLDGYPLDAAATIKNFEMAGVPVRQLYADTKEAGQMLRYALGDALFGSVARDFAQQHAKRAPTWQYYFSYIPMKSRATLQGVAHGNELPFVFGTVETLPMSKDTLMPEDKALARRVGDYWYAFAAAGKPEPAGAPAWAATDGQNNETMVFGDTVAAQSDFRTKALNAYITVYDNLSKSNLNFWALLAWKQ